MLSAANRLTSGRLFREAVQRGDRAASHSVVLHGYSPRTATGAARTTPRVGFVVGRAVGGAVQRNAVRRRLRHLMRARMAALPASMVLVARATPAAAAASYRQLGADVDRALSRLLRAAEDRRRSSSS